MPTQLRRCVSLVICVVIGLGAAERVRAQADPQGYLFNSGQTIQPFFEGWAHNPDGSFEMHFGYLNRNYVEDVQVPIGANNRMSPAGPDRGQPTYFYPRVNRRIFSVTVPADWGDRELIWQVATHEESYRAVGWLQPEWEIAATATGRAAPADESGNEAPALQLEVPDSVSLSETLTMTATVADDGLPPPPRPRSPGRGTLPTFEPPDTGPTLPVNVPQIRPDSRNQPVRVRVDRVNVTWTLLRGPIGGRVKAQDDEAPDGVATVTATFESAGNYVFRVQASDGRLSTSEEFSVTVR